MKTFKYLFLMLFALSLLQNCNSNKKTSADNDFVYQCPMDCENGKTYQESGTCPICKMDLQPLAQLSKSVLDDNEGITDASIFNLTSQWHTEEGESIQLKDLKGKTLVVVMIYTSCKAACPRLVADMRHIEADIPDGKLKDIQFVFVSIDPENDFPERLKAFAKENFMDEEHWTFLQGTKSGVREFANVLSVKYKEISPIDFSHSNIISVFDAQGELKFQQEGLGVDNTQTVATILDVTP